MWKQSKLLYSRCAVQGRITLSRNYKTAESTTKVSDVTSEDSEYALPKEARVVICGGGVMGGAVAYHLSLVGLGPETILVESGRYLNVSFKCIFLNELLKTTFFLIICLFFFTYLYICHQTRRWNNVACIRISRSLQAQSSASETCPG